MRGIWRAAMAAAAMVMIAGTASAQPSAADVVRLQGRVTAVAANQLTVQPAQGAARTIALAPDWGVQVITPITINQITAGSFVGTANVPGPNGTGRSLEVHVFPPGVRMGEGDYDWEPGSRMTNGDVGRVVDTAEGRQLEIRYPGGVRTVTVPANVPITRLVPGTQAQVRVGSMVNIIGLNMPNGHVGAQFVGLFAPAQTGSH